jgi:hypothetical protein
MNFAKLLLKLLKRVATIDIAHASTGLNEDGEFELEVVAMLDGQIAPIANLKESATEFEVTQFEAQLDLLVSAVAAQKREDEEHANKVREVLAKLTPEERILIERPLPEDIPHEPETRH